MNSRRRQKFAVTTAAVLAGLMFAGCTSDNGGTKGGGESGQKEAKSITVQTANTLPARVSVEKKIYKKFTAETGIRVKRVGVPEDQFAQVLTSQAAAGQLPDVIGSIALSQVRTIAANKLENPEATAAVVKDLGEKTWAPGVLALDRDGSTQLAVPSDSWAQLLFYRKDLFEKAGLSAPKTYADILAAAKKLNGPDMAGFVGATKAGAAFTEQTFEQIALGNGCQEVNKSGKVTFDSSECIAALKFYGNLIKDYSVPGGQDVDTTRATYFSGKAAMFIWSTFVLDEMAGLRNDAMPTCPQCKADPTFLAKNTGVVSAIKGPDGKKPALYGEVNSWAITATAHEKAAEKFVEYMLSNGYEQWLSIAPEGQVPVRQGTAKDPQKYLTAWQNLPVGVDRKAPLADFYSNTVLDALKNSANDLVQWGIPQGQGALIGAQQGELPIAKAVSQVTSGQLDAKTAAQQAAQALTSIQNSLK